MVSEVISEAILLIASVIMIGALVGAVYFSISYIGTALTSSSLLNSEKLLTTVQVVYATNVTSTKVYVYVQNVGAEPVQGVAQSTLYFGLENQQQPVGYGGPAPNWSASVEVLNPGSTMTLTLNLARPLVKYGFYTVMFDTPNGATSTYTFEVF